MTGTARLLSNPTPLIVASNDPGRPVVRSCVTAVAPWRLTLAEERWRRASSSATASSTRLAFVKTRVANARRRAARTIARNSG